MITESDLDFLHTVANRRPFYTYVFFGMNIVVFLLMTFAGGATNGSTLMAFGVKANEMIDRGEYWRFITPVFIHIGLLHLVFNSYALWMVGPQVERLYGGARFVLLYVVTGVAGVLGSYLYRPDGLSAGASGAIFGLFGVLLVFGFRYRNHVPPHFARSVGTGVLPVILINLVIGFNIQMVDNSAHIAGLLTGMALAAIVPFAPPRTETPALFLALKYVIFALIALSWIQIARHYNGPRLALQNFNSDSGTSEFIDVMNGTQRAFAGSLHALDPAAKGELPAAIKAVGKSIDGLKKIPSLSAKSDQLTSQLLALMQNQYELLQEVDRSGTMTLIQARQASENATKYRQLDVLFKEWVNTEGERYGIQLPKPQ